DIAVEGDTVIGATVECPDEADAAPEWQLQACDPQPSDGPTVWGKLIPGPDGSSLVLEPGFGADRYYAGMAVTSSTVDGSPTVVSGPVASVDELRAEDVVWLWIPGGCRESNPVQCDIAA